MTRRDPEKARQYGRSYRLMRQYGLTIEDYRALRRTQKSRCGICGRKQVSSLAVDHCHITGKVRGLLCLQCNRALGLFKDDPIRLENALAYLARAM